MTNKDLKKNTEIQKVGAKKPAAFSLPEGWEEIILGEVVEFVNDKIEIEKIDLDNYISTENLLPNKSGVQKATTLPNIAKVNNFKIGDTLFSNIRTYFKKVWFAEFDGGSSNDVLIFRPIDENILDKKFLYYFISSDEFINFTVISAKGTKMPRGDKDAMKTLKINLPPLQQQKAIAKILSAFDDKIELLREQNETLEKIGETIFKEWFGKYRVGDDLPDGWRVRKIGEKNFAEVIGSGIKEFKGEKIYLATADVSDNTITNLSTKITFQNRPSRANMQPVEKSIWFAKMKDSRKLLMFDNLFKR